jgi:Mg-chelatase subunit ChlD
VEASPASASVSSRTLSLQTFLEASQLSAGGVHKSWGLIKLVASDRFKISKKTTGMDFIVVIDHSSSMKISNKLAFVQATIEFLIGQLEQEHRFCLIQFNHEPSLVTDGLVRMTAVNKKEILKNLHSIIAEGSTNISEALLKAIGILKTRPQNEQTRISSILLFTGSPPQIPFFLLFLLFCYY